MGPLGGDRARWRFAGVTAASLLVIVGAAGAAHMRSSSSSPGNARVVIAPRTEPTAVASETTDTSASTPEVAATAEVAETTVLAATTVPPTIAPRKKPPSTSPPAPQTTIPSPYVGVVSGLTGQACVDWTNNYIVPVVQLYLSWTGETVTRYLGQRTGTLDFRDQTGKMYLWEWDLDRCTLHPLTW